MQPSGCSLGSSDMGGLEALPDLGIPNESHVLAMSAYVPFSYFLPRSISRAVAQQRYEDAGACPWT